MADTHPSVERIAEAAQSIDGAFVHTPQFRSEALSRLLGVELYVKIETANPVGSVAGRSVDWWFRHQPQYHRLVCASDGDFAIALGRVCRHRGTELDVFAPEDADAGKVEVLRRAGATVRLEGRSIDEAHFEAERYAVVVDAFCLEEGSSVEFAEGAATLAVEIEGLDVDVDTLFVPLDRSGLALGVAAWCHERMPRTRVVGVRTADGASPRQELDDTALVTDGQIDQAIRALANHEGLRVSPAGAAMLAAAAVAAPDLRDSTVVVTVTSRTIG